MNTIYSMNRSGGNVASLSLLVLSLLVLLAVGPAAADAQSTCFSGVGVSVPGCSCHPSCATCGYLNTPTGDNDCITCADGSDVTAVFGDGTGTCDELVASTSEDEENEEESSNSDATCFSDVGVGVPGCSCHPSCGTCGYLNAPTGDNDCITCADGSDVTAVFFDGTGTCDELDSDDGSHSSHDSDDGSHSSHDDVDEAHSSDEKTEKPTKKPTKKPTNRPTTKKPTRKPTNRPTTGRPTKRPTRRPTRKPS